MPVRWLPVIALDWLVDTLVLRHEKRMPKDHSGHARSELLRESLTVTFCAHLE